MTEERKVIQLVSHVVPGMDNASMPVGWLGVLCDDGTMWLGDGTGYWQEVHPPGNYERDLERARHEKGQAWTALCDTRERVEALTDALKRIQGGDDDPEEIAHEALYGHLEPGGAIIDGIER